MGARRNSSGGTNSYVEVRAVVLIAVVVGLFVISLPSLLRAVDFNGDNLPDDWEAEYGLTTNAYASTNLVGWWQLDGLTNVTDRTTNGINGTLSDFPTNAFGTGLYSNALYFATNSVVTFPTTNSVLNVSGQFTFSAWFQSTNNLSYPVTIATWSDSTNGWSVGTTTNGLANVVFFDGATEQVVQPSSSTVNLYDGGWHQVAATYDTNQVATVYVDGMAEVTNTITGWTAGAASEFVFGAPDTNTVNNPFILDEARLYNRALGAAEVPQLPPTYSDLNGTGLTTIEDYLESLDPLSTSSIVTSDFVTSGLTTFYGSSAPVLTKTGGDAQVVAASTFETNPLVVHVTDSSSTPLVGAPVTFSIPGGSDGGIALTSGGTTTTSLSTTTDASGNATIYYESGADNLKDNTITATAVYTTASVAVNFTAYCGVQSGLSLWLKADAGVTQSSGNVSSWQDQSLNQFAATQSTSGVQPVLITNASNGEPALQFSGSQYLSGTGALGILAGAGTTVITVASTIAPSEQRYSITAGGVSSAGETRNMGYLYSEQTLSVSYSDPVGGNVPQAGTFVVDTGTLGTDDTSVTFYRNGTQTGTSSATGTTNVPSGFSVGSYVGGSYAWKGNISEVLIYNRVLTSTEILEVGVYLADKYGLYNPDATWPSTYTSAVQAEITRNQWNKAQADAYVTFQAANSTMLTNGLAAWYKADAGVTYDGSNNVSSWVDQAGGYNVTQSGGSRPTYVASDINGNPALRFNGSQWLYNPSKIGPGLNSDMTIIEVGNTSNPGAQEFAAYLGQNSTGYGRDLGYYGGSQIFDTDNVYCTAGNSPSLNSFVTDVATLDSSRTAVTFYRNGQQTGTGTLSGVQDVGAGILVGAWGNPSYYGWQGDIAEVLVYDHQLSPTELQQVGVYLADKYGLYNPNATWPSTYTSAVQAEITRNQWNKSQADAYVAFQAANSTMLTNGLAAWYKADSGVTYDGSNNVSSWTDQTGAFTVTQATGGNKPTYVASDINGKPALHFNGSQWLTNPSRIGPGANADMTIIEVGDTSNPGAIQFAAYLGQSATGVGRDLGYYGGQIFDTTNIDSIAGTTPSPNDFVTDAATLNSTRTGVTFYRNGLQTGTGTLSGVQDLGAGITVGTWGNPAYYGWQGDLAEVLIYDHQLNSTELQQVGVYLADKYGLYNPNATWPSTYSSAVQAEITRNQWNKSQADNYVAMQTANPTMLTNGLTMWLKADDATSITKDGSGNISNWTDQSGNYSVQGTSGSQPTYVASDINGKPAMHFNGSQYLYNPASIGPGLNSDMTEIVVSDTSSPSSHEYSLWLGGSGGNGTGRALGNFYSTQIFDTYNIDTGSAAAPNANSFSVEAGTLDSTRTSVALYQNGTSISTGSLSGVNDVSSGITIGALYGVGVLWQGDIAEVLVYDHKLTSTELQQVGVYLADKYGLYNPNATWPSTYSSAVQAEITRNQWNKSQADNYVAMQTANPTILTNGLAMWLKADDAANITKDGSGNVSNWNDESGNYAVQGTSGSEPTYVASDVNGQPAMHFNGTQYLYSPTNIGPGLNSDMTEIVVSATSSPSAHGYTLWLGGTGGNGTGRALGNYLSTQIFDTDNIYTGSAATSSANTFTSEVGTLNSTRDSATLYQNGTAISTGSLSGVGNISSGITIGALYGVGVLWQGDIAEVLVYDHQLSSAELEQVGIYLANKYNMALSAAAPTISPDGGSFSSTTTVSFSAVTSPAVIRYTLNGSSPTATSTLYTGSFNLTGSAPVNAAVFLNNVQISPDAFAQFYVGDTGSIGISDAWQTTYFGHTGIDPTAQSPGGSGLTNLQAYLYGYNPTLFSTNGDGLSDLVNYQLGYSATNTDINGYGLTNAQQLALGLDPFDTGVNPAPPTPPTPDPTDHTAPTITLSQPANATLIP